MGENKEYLTHAEALGCIHISEEVLATIASGAAVEVEGVSGLMNLATKKTAAKAAPAAKSAEKKTTGKKCCGGKKGGCCGK